jgi:hypothetical protein
VLFGCYLLSRLQLAQATHFIFHFSPFTGLLFAALREIFSVLPLLLPRLPDEALTGGGISVLVFDLFSAAGGFDIAGHQHFLLARIGTGEVRGGIPDRMVEQVFINRIRLVEFTAEHFV